MSSLAPRQNLHTAVTFMDGLSNLMRSAVSMSPTSFTQNERELINRLVGGLKFMTDIVDFWFTDYSTAYRDATIKSVNDMFTSIIADTPVQTVIAVLVKCYETVNSQARAHVDVATSMPTVLVDLVISYTSIIQYIPTGEYINIFTALWQYVHDLSPGDGASSTAGPSTPPTVAHPISDIDWIPNRAYGIAVALMLKKYYNFDGRITYNNTPYNVDRAKLVAAYESGTKVITSADQREGLTAIIYTFKRPDWNCTAYYFNLMMLAVKNTDIIARLGSSTQHVLYSNHARISNYMPFRAWFDVCNVNGDSLWQFREGDSTTDVADTIYTIKMAGTPAYPVDSISLGPKDSAKVTKDINLDGDPILTSIIKDGKPHPDIKFTSQPIY